MPVIHYCSTVYSALDVASLDDSLTTLLLQPPGPHSIILSLFALFHCALILRADADLFACFQHQLVVSERRPRCFDCL